MDILTPGHKYAALLPQVGPAEHHAPSGVRSLVEALERGGAVIDHVALVPGITKIQFVDITDEKTLYPLSVMTSGMTTMPAVDAAEALEGDRAKQTKAFGS